MNSSKLLQLRSWWSMFECVLATSKVNLRDESKKKVPKSFEDFSRNCSFNAPTMSTCRGEFCKAYVSFKWKSVTFKTQRESTMQFRDFKLPWQRIGEFDKYLIPWRREKRKSSSKVFSSMKLTRTRSFNIDHLKFQSSLISSFFKMSWKRWKKRFSNKFKVYVKSNRRKEKFISDC